MYQLTHYAPSAPAFLGGAAKPQQPGRSRGDGTGTMTKTSSATKYFGWFGWKCAVKYRRFLGDSYPFYLEFWRSTIEKHFFEFSEGGNLQSPNFPTCSYVLTLSRPIPKFYAASCNAGRMSGSLVWTAEEKNPLETNWSKLWLKGTHQPTT